LITTSFQQGKAVRVASEVIHTNQKHPFLTKEKGFLPVGQIKLGMHVRRADGTYGVVTGWKVVAGTQVMYNLEVAWDHTFTVGVGEWVVHNSCPFAPGAENHIFEGTVKGNNAGGYHWEGDPNTPGTVIPGTETTPDARGVYEAQVSVNGVDKTANGGYSSFFPKSMSKEDVLNTIDEAYNNRVYLRGNIYQGDTSSGIVVQMYLNSSDQIISAFPLYQSGVP
jgi:hypothetical protein